MPLTRFPNVVSGDGYGMPAGEFRRRVPHEIRDESDARSRWEDKFLLGLVLLQDVILNGSR